MITSIPIGCEVKGTLLRKMNVGLLQPERGGWWCVIISVLSHCEMTIHSLHPVASIIESSDKLGTLLPVQDNKIMML